MNRQDPARQPLQRKKIWEIDECFRCALIGSCLGRGELRKLGREKVFAIEAGSNDYQLHAQFIRIAGQQDLQGKILHKYLEKKYRTATRKYFPVGTDEEIKALWAADLAEDRPDSAWWAVMTHPLASEELVAFLYGELHMLSHDGVGNSHKRKTEMTTLRCQSLEYRCASCAEQHTDNCPGLDLCGRTVLYVGGLHKMIPHLCDDSVFNLFPQ